MSQQTNTENEDPSPAKKARPLPPLEDFSKNLEAIQILRPLQQAWNLLDRDGEYLEELFEYGPERKLYLGDMAEIIKDGSCDYQNPYGEDDRESFADLFQELTVQEQQDFRSIALKCKQENRSMNDEDLNRILSRKPRQPFYVSLKPLPEGIFADGSERHPFPSMNKAAEANGCGTVDVIAIDCDCKEKMKSCMKAGCETLLCSTHGDGRGTWDPENEAVYWDWSKCKECKNVIRCFRHPIRKCDVCQNGACAEASLGCGYDPGPFWLCRKCATVCKKTIQDKYSSRDGETCGFRCCPECFKNHKCGDDPTEYC